MQFFKCSFKSPDTGFDIHGHIIDNVIRNTDSLKFSLVAQNCFAGFKIWRLNISQKPPFKTGTQTVGKRRQIFGRPVTGNNNLFFVLIKVIEGMKKLLLGTFFAFMN
jgi:hypothetical protein